MTIRNAADLPAAIRHLAEAGYSVRQLASVLDVARSTVYRWRSGRYSPNRSNLLALREWVDQTFAVEANRRRLTGRAEQLQAAFTALEDPQERAEFGEEMRAKRAAIVAQRKPPSVTYVVDDPFAVVNADRDMATVEAVFG